MSERTLDQLSDARLEPGTVALVGGGPGALDLVTVRGLALLRQADVVVVDRLGPVALTELLGDQVEVIGVGKKPGHPSLRQAEIEQILVDQARAGRRVVRLKGGDPFVLGRGGEEVLACRAAGIDVQVVPGVTSAIAGPAAGDVPVTHRGTAVATHIVNAHGDLGPADLAALADPGTTTVLMMGVEWLPRLVSQALLNGIDAATPVAVVQEATLPDQRVVRGTLGTIEQVVREAGIGFPAVIVAGRTAAEGFLVPPDPHGLVRGSGREAIAADSGEADDSETHGTSDPAAGAPVADARRSPVLIGCAHGTRSRGGRDVMRSLMMAIREAAPEISVREAYVDVQQPEIDAAVAAVAQPVQETRTRESDEVDAVVVPLLLSTGYHVRHDIGSAVRGRRAIACGPLGPDPRLAEVMAQRLREAGAGADDEDEIVMAAAGTSDPAGQAMVEQMAGMLSDALGRHVHVGYVSAAQPTVAEAVARAREDSGRAVAIASYLLIPGHFQSALDAAGADLVAEPLGAHPLVVDLALDRYRAAVGE